MHEQFDMRRKLMLARLNRLKGVKCWSRWARFTAFPNVSGVFGRSFNGVTVKTPMDFCSVALEPPASRSFRAKPSARATTCD